MRGLTEISFIRKLKSQDRTNSTYRTVDQTLLLGLLPSKTIFRKPTSFRQVLSHCGWHSCRIFWKYRGQTSNDRLDDL